MDTVTNSEPYCIYEKLENGETQFESGRIRSNKYNKNSRIKKIRRRPMEDIRKNFMSKFE